MKTSSLILTLALIFTATAETALAQRMHLDDESEAAPGSYIIRKTLEAQADAAKTAEILPNIQVVLRTNGYSPTRMVERFLTTTAQDTVADARFKQLGRELMTEITTGQTQGLTADTYAKILLDQRFEINKEGVAEKKMAVLAELAKRINTENDKLRYLTRPRPML